MHDIAGCRLIFRNINALEKFRKNLHKSQFKHQHQPDKNKYNYITSPKVTGYRGVHDVYKYVAKTKAGEQWNGLHVEIQYRTTAQHAWATAVEIAGSLTANQPKFNRGDEDHKEFFRLTSEIIARTEENCKSCYPDLIEKELKRRFSEIENRTHLLRTLKNITKANQSQSEKKGEVTQNMILISDEENRTLITYSFRTSTDAVEAYFKLEKTEGRNKDIVLVRADSSEYIKNAFRNYFSDASDFVKLIESGLLKLK